MLVVWFSIWTSGPAEAGTSVAVLKAFRLCCGGIRNFLRPEYFYVIDDLDVPQCVCCPCRSRLTSCRQAVRHFPVILRDTHNRIYTIYMNRVEAPRVGVSFIVQMALVSLLPLPLTPRRCEHLSPARSHGNRVLNGKQKSSLTAEVII